MNIVKAIIEALREPLVAFITYMVGYYQGKAKERAYASEKILERIKTANAPVTDGEREWLRNKFNK